MQLVFKLEHSHVSPPKFSLHSQLPTLMKPKVSVFDQTKGSQMLTAIAETVSSTLQAVIARTDKKLIRMSVAYGETSLVKFIPYLGHMSHWQNLPSPWFKLQMH